MGTSTTSPLILATSIHTMTMFITHTMMGRLRRVVYLTLTMPVIICTTTQIRIPSTPTITVSTIVLIAATAMPLWYLRSRIPTHSPITIMSDKRVSLRIPTRMSMSIPTSHILIPALHLLMKSKPTMARSHPQSGNENPILVAHHCTLQLKTTKPTNHHPQLKFHFRSHLLWIRPSPLVIRANSNMTTIPCTTMMLDMDTPPTLMVMTTITMATVTTCAGYSCTSWRYVSSRFCQDESQRY